MSMPPPVGTWHPVTCAKCGLLVGWTRAPLLRPFYCIPHFDEVAHLDDALQKLPKLRGKP